MIKEVIRFQTTDGKEFVDMYSANQHETSLKQKRIKNAVDVVQKILKSQGQSTNNSRQNARAEVRRYLAKLDIFKALEGCFLISEDKLIFDNSSPRTL